MLESSKDEDQRAIRAADEAVASKSKSLSEAIEAIENDPRVKHVDDFIDHDFRQHCFARYVLLHMRLSAVLRMDFQPFCEHLRLICTYQKERWLVTHASRLGVIGLRKDLHAEPIGYDVRVNIDQCSDWSLNQQHAMREISGDSHLSTAPLSGKISKSKSNRAGRRVQSQKGKQT